MTDQTDRIVVTSPTWLAQLWEYLEPEERWTDAEGRLVLYNRCGDVLRFTDAVVANPTQEAR